MTERAGGKTLNHPFFARMWTVMSAHETPLLRRLRTENLAGLSGRVLEVGAGTGTNPGASAVPVPVTLAAPRFRCQ